MLGIHRVPSRRPGEPDRYAAKLADEGEMALWQFSFHLVPRTVLLHSFGVVPCQITGDEFASLTSWTQVNREELEGRIGQILPINPDQSFIQMRLWGTFEENRIELIDDDNGACAEIYGRFDLRELKQELVIGVLGFAQAYDALLLTSDLNVIEPRLDCVVQAIMESRAFAFVSDPRGFIEDFARENQSADAEGRHN